MAARPFSAARTPVRRGALIQSLALRSIDSKIRQHAGIFAILIGNPALTKAFLALLIKPDSGTRRCFTITKPVPMHSGQSRSDGLMTGFFIYFFSVCGAGNPFNSQNIALMSLSRSGSSRRPRY
jgi:hypothetical protein